MVAREARLSDGRSLTDAAVERLRADTPGCGYAIHLDNAGAALQPQPVLDAVVRHLWREAEVGAYAAADEARACFEHVYDEVAGLLNARRDEIALVDSATRAFDAALGALPLRRGDVILTTTTEYASNYLAYLRRARDLNLTIRVVPEDADGTLSLVHLERMLTDPRARLVAMSHVPSQSGLVQPAAAVGRLARAAGCWYLLDASQSAGQIPLDVNALGCDALAASGRKYLRGPRATGFLYVRRERLDDLHPTTIDLHSATWTGLETYELAPNARRFETWEKHVAGLLGLGAAVAYARRIGVDVIWPRIRSLADELRVRLRRIPGVAVHDRGAERCGIVSFTVAGITAGAVQTALARLVPRITVSTSSARATMLDFPARGLSETIRASVHYYTSDADLDLLAEAIARVRQTPMADCMTEYGCPAGGTVRRR